MRTIKSAGLALTLLFLFGISGNTVAQTEETKKQTPEVEQLKQRLQQLEETVQQLKGQIGALEEQKTVKVVEATYSEPAVSAAVPSAKPQDDPQ